MQPGHTWRGSIWTSCWLALRVPSHVLAAWRRCLSLWHAWLSSLLLRGLLNLPLLRRYAGVPSAPVTAGLCELHYLSSDVSQDQRRSLGLPALSPNAAGGVADHHAGWTVAALRGSGGPEAGDEDRSPAVSRLARPAASRSSRPCIRRPRRASRARGVRGAAITVPAGSTWFDWSNWTFSSSPNLGTV